jgi:hypothetical protein
MSDPDDLVLYLQSRPWNIEALRLSRDDTKVADLELSLRSQRPPSGRLLVEFRGVEDLEFRQVSSNVGVVLQVVSLAERGLEQVRYRVSDTGNRSLNFYCSDVVVSNPKTS